MKKKTFILTVGIEHVALGGLELAGVVDRGAHQHETCSCPEADVDRHVGVCIIRLGL